MNKAIKADFSLLAKDGITKSNVRVELLVPSQEEIDGGEMPSIHVDLSYMNEDDFDKIDGVFWVDALELFSAGVKNAEDADVVAEWLEGWAEDIREKFKNS